MGLRTLHRALLIAGAGVVLAAMVAVMPATANAAGLQLTVSPKVSAADTPLTIGISGAQPGAKVALSVTSVDAAGTKWSSTSTYTASPAGTVGPATSAEMSTGTDPMGPVDFMAADRRAFLADPDLAVRPVEPLWEREPHPGLSVLLVGQVLA